MIHFVTDDWLKLLTYYEFENLIRFLRKICTKDFRRIICLKISSNRLWCYLNSKSLSTLSLTNVWILISSLVKLKFLILLLNFKTLISKNFEMKFVSIKIYKIIYLSSRWIIHDNLKKTLSNPIPKMMKKKRKKETTKKRISKRLTRNIIPSSIFTRRNESCRP